MKTLNVTFQELTKSGRKELASEIGRILSENLVEKPTNHNRPDDKETNHYRINLDTDAIFEIVSMFGDLEAGSLGLLNYEPTTAATFYARMLDKWNNLLSYR
ncbi:hypothetical protein [Tunicatimonas pelagia]|uniref:hypothetical protein n=1 Tax=Tunicatimonas pelagia TaxID=931531 RepID=UPI002666B99E|nr:hypothetical protein [Tunicatimonas pelagia]WKN40871.1 hypothetical protein P0M28_17690 [Tunicatimonas pelagia]